MALNLNTGPYYDDFDETKKFNRVLFKPGFAVQGRELTQLQTILQNQLNNFGKHLFVNGAPVLGCKGVPLRRDFIKVNDIDASANSVSNDTLSNYIGDTVTGNTSGIIGKIDAVAEGLDTEAIDKKTLYISYSQGDSTGTYLHFEAGETLTVTSTDSGRNGDTFVVDTTTSSSSPQNYFGKGLFFVIEDGIVFADGRFIIHDKQEITLEKYKLNANYSVGLTINDSIVTSADDATLLDPATGTFNFNAPGADRYKITTTIGKLASGATNDADFINLYSVVDGKLSTTTVNTDLDIYGLIGDRIAQRTFDESGHYTIKNFTLTVREHFNDGSNRGLVNAVNGGSNSHIAIGVSDGSAVVRGRKRVFQSPTYLKVAKGNNTKTEEGFTTSTTYGNYVLVNNVAGEWDINGGDIVQLGDATLNANMSNTGILTLTSIGAADVLRREGVYTINANEWTVSPSGGTGARFSITIDSSGAASVEIIDGGTGFAASDTITIPDQRLGNGGAANLTFDVNTIGSSRGSTFGSVAAPSTVIGQARVRHIARDSGTPGDPSAEYRLYLYDIKMTAGKFADVRSVFFDSDISNFNGAADTVLTNGNAVLKETTINSMVFKSPITATKTHAVDTGGTYDNTFTYQKEYSVTFTTTGTASITTAGTETFPYSTTPSQTQLDDEFIMVFQEAVTIDGTGYAAGQVFDLQTSHISSAGASSISFDIGTTWSATTDVKFYVKVKQTDVNPVPFTVKSSRYVKIDTSTNEGGTSGPWNLGICNVYKIEEIFVDGTSYLSSGTDYTEEFTLDTGQRDNYYGHSKLYKKPTSNVNTSNKFITVKLSYLDPNYAGSNSTYFAIDSYPTDELTNPTPTFYTYEIPIFANSKGNVLDLRDCIDFRPFINNTSTDTTVLGSATENPADIFELRSIGGQQYPFPSETFTTDAEYYLGRIDKVILDDTGRIYTVTGASRAVPVVPQQEPGTMVLGTVRIPPYPSLSPYVAKTAKRPDLACQVNIRQNRRFTMQDIGALEKRLARLEYYTSLNFLEMNTADKVIQDANGLDRFKNGFFVDTFSNHKLANLQDPNYNFGVDPVLKFGSANYYNENIDIVFDAVNSTNVTRKGNLVTLPYTHTVFTENTKASKPRNCVGELLFQYVGDMEIFPPADNFVNFEDGGERNIEQDDMADAIDKTFEKLGEAGIINGIDYVTKGLPDQVENITFSDSASDSAGSEVNTGNGTVNSSAEVNVSFNATANVYSEIDQFSATHNLLTVDTGEHSLVKDSFGDVLTNVALAPYMREQVITVVTTMLKPNTKYFAYFDGDPVSTKCRPVTTSAWNTARSAGIDNFWSSVIGTSSFGDSLVSDSDGTLVLQFRIPASTYRTGSRAFRLTDDPYNRDKFTRSAANATFESNGLNAINTELTLSTQVPNINFGTVVGDSKIIGNFVTDVRIDDLSSNITVDLEIGNEFTPDPPVPEPAPAPVEPDIPVIDWNFFDWNLDFGSFGTDPVAQTFVVNNNEGIFASKVDLYFRTKPTTGNNGIVCQIREVVNGFPGSSIVPYSNVYKKPSEVNTSVTAGDGSVTFNATTFEFDSLVYLKPGKEYCIVLLPQGNDPNYEIWVSELGDFAVGTTERIIATDTTNGIFFSSSNNRTWNAHQAEDMKFALYRADFTVGSSSIAKFTNSNIDYLKLDNFTNGKLAPGEKLHGFDITLSNGGSGYVANEIITLNAFGNGTGLKIKVLSETSGVIDSTLGVGFEITAMGSGYDSDPSGTVSQASTDGSGSGATFTITTKVAQVERFDNLYNVARVSVSDGTFSVSDKISDGTTEAVITVIENKTYNKLKHNIAQLKFPKCSIDYQFAGTKSSGVSVKGTTFDDLIVGENKVTTEEFAVYSYSNEVANLSSNKSFNLNATLTSPSTAISPVIDLSKSSIITTVNRINNDTTNEDARIDGNADCKYISKIVRLNENNEAEDLRVYLDQRVPAGSNVKVYGKFLSSEDDAEFREDLFWVELAKVQEPTISQQNSFVENEYKIPVKGSNDIGTNASGVLEYDVTRVTSTTITAGGSGYTGIPTVTFSGGGAYKQAKGIAQISAGAVTGIIITDPGRGYTGTPTITISGGGGSGATATATTGDVTYESFINFAVKIVLTTSNTSKVPSVKNLRAIALQA